MREKVVKQILLKLDGWVLDTDIEEKELTDMDYNKAVSKDEVESFYDDAYAYACGYLQRKDLMGIRTAQTALIFWAAGLLWEKHNIRENNNEDDTNPFGYGDKLIIQAKEMLKPYKTYSFHAY